MDEFVNELLTPASQVVIIMGIAEACKKAGVPNRYIPVIDLLLGMLSGLVVFSVAYGNDLIESCVMGIAMGLSACGLFSGIKNTLE